MQLSCKITGPNAPMLSHLIAKNPANLYEREEKGHKIRLVYTTYTEQEAEFLLYIVPDSIELARNSASLYDITSYINDREFAVSSLFCSYMRSALGTALNGKPKEEYRRWVNRAFPLQVRFGPVTSNLSDVQITQLFEALGYKTIIEHGKTIPSKPKSSARFITLEGEQTVQHVLRHVAVFIPVLDDYKHYFIDEKEVEKLDRYGEGWLETHPQREMIVKRFLRFQEMMKKSKFYISAEKEESIEPKVRLNDLRYEAILSDIKKLPHKQTVVDMGAGEGRLSVRLGFMPDVREVLAVEPSQSAQMWAAARFEKAKQQQGFQEPTLLWGSLYYKDDRLRHKDVMIVCEVIEHINEDRLPGIFEMIFSDYQPRTLLVTTPNQEYNACYELGESMRHSDHRFEWTREEFQSHCKSWIQHHHYEVVFKGIGQEHEQYGFPTQLAVFSRKEKKA